MDSFLEIGPQDVFVDPERNSEQARLRSYFAALTPTQQEKLAVRISQSDYTRPSAIPAILSRDLFEWSQAAAEERAVASTAFLKDIYSHESPDILTEVPRLRDVLRTNPYFLKRLVGSPSTAGPWNIEMAMDWALSKRGSQSLEPVIVENDTCAIGGLLTLPVISDLLRREWRDHARFDAFEDGTLYLDRLLSIISQNAKHYRPGRPLLFAEDYLNPYLAEGSRHWLRERILDAGFLLAGTYNRSRLHFDPVLSQYHLDGQALSAVFLHYYPCVFDRHYPEFTLVADYLKDDSNAAHAVDGFWGHYADRGYATWLQTNAIGAEVLCDKATASFLPDIVRFYLRRQPLIQTSTYITFVDNTGGTDHATVHRVFDDPLNWVIKSRRDSGQGMGIYLGHRMANGEILRGRSWDSLRVEVDGHPLDFVAQPLIDEPTFALPGKPESALEFRNIVHTVADDLISANQVFVRAAPKLQSKNISTNHECFLLPVLIPKSPLRST